jgi:uncharacterized protein (TIGR00251 family)
LKIAIFVVPNAKQTEIVGEHDGRLKLKIHAPPVDGKANAEVIRFFAEKYGVPKSRVRIVSGEKSRKKTVEIIGVVGP